jgi:poly(3-hydroxyalkanoate) synthetase
VSDDTVFFAVLGVCVGGVLLALAVVLYSARRAERKDGRWR